MTNRIGIVHTQKSTPDGNSIANGYRSIMHISKDGMKHVEPYCKELTKNYIPWQPSPEHIKENGGYGLSLFDILDNFATLSLVHSQIASVDYTC